MYKKHTNANNIDKALLLWFTEVNKSDITLNDSTIQEKARELNKSLNGDPNFAASNGWYSRWKKRHNITKLEDNSFVIKSNCKSSSRLDSFEMTKEELPSTDTIDDCTRPSILFIEPFYGGSHKQLIDTLLKEFEFKEIEIKLVTLPAKKWPWRARCGSLILSQIIPKKPSYKVLFCSSVLNLSELLGLRPDLQPLKKVVYFHENQLVYPKKDVKERDFQFGYNQITTCLAADHIIFNSTFNLNSFIWSVDNFLKIMPDCKPKDLFSKIKPKTSVISFPINFSKIPKMDKNYDKTLHIIWPHRWEFDKGPDEYFSVLFRLKNENLKFKLSVLGESFSEVPEVFEKARNILQDEILHWGYAQTKEEYYDILNSGHVVVSTAVHEFYGVAMLEAVHCNCYPLVPDRLVYPEIYDKECLYNGETDLFHRLQNYCCNPAAVKDDYGKLTINLKKYDTETLIPEFVKLFLE